MTYTLKQHVAFDELVDQVGIVLAVDMVLFVKREFHVTNPKQDFAHQFDLDDLKAHKLLKIAKAVVGEQ